MKLIDVIYNEIIGFLNEAAQINEYITNDEIYLRDYLSMPKSEKLAYLPHEYSYFFDDFLEETDYEFNSPKEMRPGNYVDAPDEEVDMFDSEIELITWLEHNDMKTFNAFAEYLYNKINNNTLPISDSEYPAWSYFDENPTLVKNQWLIHFTDDADGIAREGFKYGVDDMTKLGLTTHLGDFDKKYGGYNFAYTIGEFNKYAKGNYSRGKYKYGKEAVVFNASGIKVWHYGDEEPQVIFYGNTARNIIPITGGENSDYAIFRKDGTVLFEHDDLETVVYWLINNFQQYRKALNENNENYTSNGNYADFLINKPFVNSRSKNYFYHGTSISPDKFALRDDYDWEDSNCWSGDLPEGYLFLTTNLNEAKAYGQYVIPCELKRLDYKMFTINSDNPSQIFDKDYGIDLYMPDKYVGFWEKFEESGKSVLIIKGTGRMTLITDINNIIPRTDLATEYYYNGLNRQLNENRTIDKLFKFDGRSVIFDDGYAHAELNIEPLEDGEISINISEIWSDIKGSGYATKLLNKLKRYSDKTGVPLSLRASTTNNIKTTKGLNQDELVNWYIKNGFRISEENNRFPSDSTAPFMIYNY